MANLVDTSNVTVEELQISREASRKRVRAFGDGNCALNAFALTLIDLIKRDQLKMEEADFARLIAEIRSELSVLENRQRFYAGATNTDISAIRNPYADLAQPLQDFINYINNNPIINFESFASHVRAQDNRVKIAALHVALAPALRKIGFEEYLNKLNAIHDADGIVEARGNTDNNGFDKDGVDLNQGFLDTLANEFFKFNLETYKKNNDNNEYSKISTSNMLRGKPTVSLLHSGAHWDALFPSAQTDGIIADLSAKPREEQKQATSFVKLEELITIKNQLKQKADKDTLSELAQTMNVTSQNLLNQLSKDMSADESKVLQEQTQEVAKISEEILKTVRDKFNLAQLNLSAIEKKLVTGTDENGRNIKIDSHLDADEALARSLQNAEILNFLQSHYQKLAPKAAVNTAQNQSQESAEQPPRRLKR